MSPTPSRAPAPGRPDEQAGPTAGTVAAAFLVDLACILVFAFLGRRSHEESSGLVGVLTTAWPFAVGCLAGWLATVGWRRPRRLMPTGLGVWLTTVALGMVLRALTGSGTAVSFVVVATVVLGLFLLGWRLLARAREKVLAR